MKNSELIKTVFLDVDQKTTWEYLTEPDKLALWFHAPKTAITSVGDYAFFGTDSGDKMCWGEVKVYEPHTRLAYSFSIKPAPDLVTDVEWVLDAVTGGTRLTMKHIGLGQAGLGLMMGLDAGWDAHFAKMRGISA